MFQLESKTPRSEDFQVLSVEDKRALKLRIRTFKNLGWVRLELADGFQPGASYQFRYLPAHDTWSYPDKADVKIDEVSIRTEGQYAIELAPRPAHRIITVPTTAGSCTEPTKALVQEFSYALPNALVKYRDALAYWVDPPSFTPRSSRKRKTVLYEWSDSPQVYNNDGRILGQPYLPEYSSSKNAVVTTCPARWSQISLRGSVAFPEVDERVYRTDVVKFDMNKNAAGQCSNLEALLQTMENQNPEKVLRQVCGHYLGGGFFFEGKSLASSTIEEWEFQLSFLYGIAPACNLAALGHLWGKGQLPANADVAARLGAALRTGMERTQPSVRDDAVHALFYLVRQIPKKIQPQTVPHLLAPIQPVLVDAMTETSPSGLDELARLIIWSTALPADLRQKLHAIVEGKSPAALHARTILAAFAVQTQ